MTAQLFSCPELDGAFHCLLAHCVVFAVWFFQRYQTHFQQQQAALVSVKANDKLTGTWPETTSRWN